jgi:hypothetical protein
MRIPQKPRTRDPISGRLQELGRDNGPVQDRSTEASVSADRRGWHGLPKLRRTDDHQIKRRGAGMPFNIIPAVLGTSFVVIWLFIGGMILRDGQQEARRRRELGAHPAHPQLSPPHGIGQLARMASS